MPITKLYYDQRLIEYYKHKTNGIQLTLELQLAAIAKRGMMMLQQSSYSKVRI